MGRDVSDLTGPFQVRLSHFKIANSVFEFLLLLLAPRGEMVIDRWLMLARRLWRRVVKIKNKIAAATARIRVSVGFESMGRRKAHGSVIYAGGRENILIPSQSE
jgi:hypothetical protein